jgi:hypothetical protein
MISKNKRTSAAERLHLTAVKELPCSICDEPAPSEAHHIDQSSAWTCVALCPECHRGEEMGWHGRRTAWRIYKMEPLDALGVTIQRLMEGRE